MRILLCLTLFFSPLAQSADRVENGDAIAAQSTITRSIAYMYSTRGLCSATFLTSRFLLTAAHCTDGWNPSAITMRLRNSQGTWFSAKVKRLITHPEFRLERTPSGTKVFKDVGLIELAEAFPFKVHPLRIAGVTEFQESPQLVSIWGYGRSSQMGGTGLLRRGYMRAIATEIDLFYDREGLSMVPETDQALCGGDSGGPVLKTISGAYYVIGVNSLSNGCKGAVLTTSKAEVAINFRPWIRQYIPGI